MCLAVPGRIVALDGTAARVDFGGIERNILTDLLDAPAVGEWVLAHAGFAIQKLDVAEAEELVAMFAEMEAQAGEELPTEDAS